MEKKKNNNLRIPKNVGRVRGRYELTPRWARRANRAISVIMCIAMLSSAIIPFAILNSTDDAHAGDGAACIHECGKECYVVPDGHICAEDGICEPVYGTIQVSAGHYSHSDKCYEQILVSGHECGPGCEVEQQVYTCGMDGAQGGAGTATSMHSHSDDCVKTITVAECGKKNSPPVYGRGSLVCDIEEGKEIFEYEYDYAAGPIGWICHAATVSICGHGGCTYGEPCLADGGISGARGGCGGEGCDGCDDCMGSFIAFSRSSGSIATDERWFVFDDGAQVITGFNYAPGASPTELIIPSEIRGVPVLAIGDGVFPGLGITSLEFEGGTQIEHIGANAFRNNPLTSITLPDSMKTLGSNAFFNCNLLTYANLGNSLETIGTSAFLNCVALQTVVLPESGTLTTIGDSAFSGCSRLVNINIPASLATLGNSAFISCTSLRSVDLSHTSVTDLMHAFQYCRALTEVKLPDGLLSIRGGTFNNTGLTDITVPGNVVTIGSDAFGNFSANGHIRLPNHSPSDLTGAPWNARNAIIHWKADPNNLDSVFLFETGTGLIYGLRDSIKDIIEELEIPDYIDGVRVAGLAEGVFGSRPANIVIRTVKFHPNSQITAIPDRAFSNNRILTAVTNLPAGLKSIGVSAFSGCNLLQAISIPDGVEFIGAGAFQECHALVSIALPAALEAVQNNTFNGCTGLAQVTFPANLRTIASNAFTGCSSLTSITIPANVETVGAAFANCTALKTVTFQGAAITSINTGAFFNTSMENIYLRQKPLGSIPDAPWGAGNATIHWQDYQVTGEIAVDSSGLWRFNMRTGVIIEYLGPYGSSLDLVVPSTLMFAGTPFAIRQVGGGGGNPVVPPGSSVRSLTISDGIEWVTGSIFMNLKIGQLYLGNTVTDLSAGVFRNCGLTSITLPLSVREIHAEAFANNNLSGLVVLPGNLISVSQTAFSGNPGIMQFQIQMYRVRASDPGGFDPVAGTYLRAGSAVQNTFPFGAAHGTPGYYMDDPQPLYEYDIIPEPGTNSAIIVLRSKMSVQGITIASMEAFTGMPPLVSVDLAANPDVHSVAKMRINVTDGNGPYTFVTTPFVPPHSHLYTVNAHVFHNVTFDGNGNTGGTAPQGGVYVQTYALQMPGQGGLTKVHPGKDDYIFAGWNTAPDGSGANYDAGEIMQVPGNDVTLYAQWTETVSPDWERLRKATAADGVDTVVIHPAGANPAGSPVMGVAGNDRLQGGTYHLVIQDAGQTTTIVRDGLHVAKTAIEITQEVEIRAASQAITLSVPNAADNTGRHFIVGAGGNLAIGNGIIIDGYRLTTNNTANNGGGIHVGSGGNLTLRSGATIQNCKAIFGGGVYVDGGRFWLQGGTITGNRATVGGGVAVNGVTVSGGTFDMSAGTITGNVAGDGGGVALAEMGILNMSGGTVTGNTGNNSSGGVYLYSGTLNMSGGTVTGNNAGFAPGIHWRDGNINVSGSPVISSDNAIIRAGANPQSMIIRVIGELSASASISVAYALGDAPLQVIAQRGNLSGSTFTATPGVPVDPSLFNYINRIEPASNFVIVQRSTTEPGVLILAADFEFEAPIIDFGIRWLTHKPMWYGPDDPQFILKGHFQWSQLELSTTPFTRNGSNEVGAIPVNGDGNFDLLSTTVLYKDQAGRDENNNYIWRPSDFGQNGVDMRALVMPGNREVKEVYQSTFTWTFIND